MCSKHWKEVNGQTMDLLSYVQTFYCNIKGKIITQERGNKMLFLSLPFHKSYFLSFFFFFSVLIMC